MQKEGDKKNSIIIIIAIILGLISIIWGLSPIFLPYSLKYNFWGNGEFFLYLCIFSPASIIGLILGIISFKFTKRIFKRVLAIFGIVLCLVALGIWLFWYSLARFYNP